MSEPVPLAEPAEPVTHTLRRAEDEARVGSPPTAERLELHGPMRVKIGFVDPPRIRGTGTARRKSR